MGSLGDITESNQGNSASQTREKEEPIAGRGGHCHYTGGGAKLRARAKNTQWRCPSK